MQKIYVLLTKCEVKMAGYQIGQILFLRVYGPRGMSRSKTPKKERGQYPAVFNRLSSYKGFIIWLGGNFLAGYSG